MFVSRSQRPISISKIWYCHHQCSHTAILDCLYPIAGRRFDCRWCLPIHEAIHQSTNYRLVYFYFNCKSIENHQKFVKSRWNLLTWTFNQTAAIKSLQCEVFLVVFSNVNYFIRHFACGWNRIRWAHKTNRIINCTNLKFILLFLDGCEMVNVFSVYQILLTLDLAPDYLSPFIRCLCHIWILSLAVSRT